MAAQEYLMGFRKLLMACHSCSATQLSFLSWVHLRRYKSLYTGLALHSWACVISNILAMLNS